MQGILKLNAQQQLPNGMVLEFHTSVFSVRIIFGIENWNIGPRFGTAPIYLYRQMKDVLFTIMNQILLPYVPSI